MNGLRAATNIPRHLACLLLAGAVLLAAACSVSPLRLFSSNRATQRPVIALKRCDETQDVLCLITFGLEPPDQMILVLQGAPGLPEELEAVVTHNDIAVAYACKPTGASPSIIYCTGPQLPLGSRLHIEVLAVQEHILLASGDFVLNALALPTVPLEGDVSPSPSADLTPSPTLTRRPSATPPQSASATLTPRPVGTLSPTSTPLLQTATRTRTPTPGTAYPNPKPRK